MKKGFTLIELLAVIVILAIIALIATPIVLNIIKDSRESAGLRSAEMYLDAVEQTVSIEKMNNTSFNPSTCTIKEDGNLTCEGTDVQVEVKGEKPLKGNIIFQSGKITEVRLEYKNKKIVLKNEKGNLEYFDYNRNSDMNFIVEGIKEQKTTSGKNLFDVNKAKDTTNWSTTPWHSMPLGLSAGTYTISFAENNLHSDNTTAVEYNIAANIGPNINTHLNNVRLGGSSSSSSSALKKYTFTIIDGEEYYMHFWSNKGGTDAVTEEKLLVLFDELLIDIQIESGSTATDYEPYTGAQPSPNPNYPQEIPLAGTLNTKTGKYDIGVTASIEGGKSQTLTLTSPVKLTKWDKLVKRDGIWGWSVWSESINAKEKTINTVNYLDETSGTVNFDVPNAVAKQSSGIYCNRAITGIVLSGHNNKFRIYENDIQIRLEYPEGITRSSSNADMIAAYTNLFNTKEYIFQYQTLDEQAFHPLPDEEQTLLYKLKL